MEDRSLYDNPTGEAMKLGEAVTVRHFMTIKEVAEYLRVHPMTVYRWIQKKKVPAARIGWMWRFRKDVIDRWAGFER